MVKSKTLLERLEWILKERDYGQRELSRKSGFKDDAHVGVIFDRLRDDPQYADRMSLEVYRKLAKGGQVSLIWLQHGIGSPNDLSAPTFKSERFPSLETLLFKEGRKWSDYTVAYARHLELSEDPSPEQWIEILDMIEEGLSAELVNVSKRLSTRPPK